MLNPNVPPPIEGRLSLHIRGPGIRVLFNLDLAALWRFVPPGWRMGLVIAAGSGLTLLVSWLAQR